MSGHLMLASPAGMVETEPSEPDSKGNRWRRFAILGDGVQARCSCGLALTGHRHHVIPLARKHTRGRGNRLTWG